MGNFKYCILQSYTLYVDLPKILHVRLFSCICLLAIKEEAGVGQKTHK